MWQQSMALSQIAGDVSIARFDVDATEEAHLHDPKKTNNTTPWPFWFPLFSQVRTKQQTAEKAVAG